jgi:LPS export ABC transporter protein LptC
MKPLRSDSDTYRKLNILSVAALFAGAAILFLGCKKNNLEEIKAFYSTENLPKLEEIEFETLYTDSGQIRFFLKAPKMLQYESDNGDYFEFPEGLQLFNYDKNKRVTSSITANYARQYLADKKWEAKNNVIATNAQGDTLKTELLIWEEKKDLIHTDEFVKIIRADQIITGIGFTSDQKMQNWKIKNPKGTIYVSLENKQNQDSARATTNMRIPDTPIPDNQPLNLNNPQNP